MTAAILAITFQFPAAFVAPPIALAATASATASQVSPVTGTASDTYDDLATVTGAESDGGGGFIDPTGFVTFSYCWSPTATPGSCASGTQIGVPLELVGGTTGDGLATVSLTGWTPAEGPGFYLLHADYAGDTMYDPSADDGSLEAFHAFGTTTTATVADPNSGTLGDLFDDVATVTGSASDGSGGRIDPTGSVDFYACVDLASFPTECTSGTAGAISLGSVALLGGTAGDGIATATFANWWAPVAGYYLFHAEYGGDATYRGSADPGTNETILVALASTTTATTVDPTTGMAAATYGDLATVTGTSFDGGSGVIDPTGFVTFSYCWSPTATPGSCASGTQIGSPVALVDGTTGDGIATAALVGWSPADGAGFYLLHAEYTGDTRYDASADDGTLEAFHAWGPTTTVTATDPTSGTFGDVFDDLVTVTGSASDGTGGKIDPTGSVEFWVCAGAGAFPVECTAGTPGAVSLGLDLLDGGANTADGIATVRLVDWWAPAAGYYRLHAVYGGDSVYTGSADDGTDETILVAPATTTTVTRTDPTTGIDEGVFDDLATVTGHALDDGGGVVDPTGFVTFSYCWSVSAFPATCTNGTQIGSPIALVDGTAGDGIATALLDGWHPEAGAGYYRLHAEYTGDTGYLGSADDGANETLRVWGTVITTTAVDPTTGGYGEVYSDAVHLAGDAPNGSGGIFDPTGWVRFYYCWSGSGPVTSCDATIGTPITSVRVVVDDDPADGDATTGLTGWMPPRSGWYLLHAVYLGDSHYVPSVDDGTNEAIAAAYSLVTYTGDSVHSTADGANVALNATIEAPAPCLASGTVTYVLKDMSGNTVGSPIVVTLPTAWATTVALSSGLYEVVVTFAPDTEGCTGGEDVGVVAVLNPGDTSNGGGWYKPERAGYSWSGSPRVNFGYNVVKQTKTDRRTGLTTVTYRGNLIWINKGQWRLTGGFAWTGTTGDFAPYGTFDCPGSFLGTLPAGYTGAKCGSFRGSGVLQRWNDATGWVTDTMFTPDGHVTFTASMYDGGQVKVCKTTGKKTSCTAKDNADWFGIQVDPVPTTAIREAPPAILWGGSVKVN